MKKPFKIYKNLNSNTQNSYRSGNNPNNESIETILMNTKRKENEFSSYSNLFIQNEEVGRTIQSIRDNKITSNKFRSSFPQSIDITPYLTPDLRNENNDYINYNKPQIDKRIKINLDSI